MAKTYSFREVEDGAPVFMQEGGSWHTMNAKPSITWDGGSNIIFSCGAHAFTIVHGTDTINIHREGGSNTAFAGTAIELYDELNDIGNFSEASSTPGGSVSWEDVTDKPTISGTNTGDQDLSALAPKASPALTGVPTAPTATAGTNTTQLATAAFVQAAITALINSSPGALDTLNELAAALGNDANFATTVTNALALRAMSLNPTAVKTSAYTAAANDFVPVDTTSGAVAITLPSAPANKTVIGIKHVIQGGTNAVSWVCGGSDVINKTGGSTSGTLTYLNQAVLLQYNSGIWYVVADDLPLSALNSIYAITAGVSGGQTIKGSTSTNSGLNLVTTSANGSTGADIVFSGGNNGATEFGRVLNNGNWGIGINNPSSKLEVIGNSRDGALTVKGTQPGFYLINTISSRNWNMWVAGNSETWGAGSLVFFDATAGLYRFGVNASGSFGLGTTSPSSSSLLEVSSTTKGVLFPRMTETQRDAISSPAEGLIIYNLTSHKLNVRTASSWEEITSA